MHLFNNGLPHVSVRELEIQYNIGKLGPIYGRGRESNLNIFPNSINSLNPNLIKVFPNPTSEELTIKTPYKLSNGMVCFYNLTGQLVFRKELSSDFIKISVKELERACTYIKFLVTRKSYQKIRF